MGFFSSKQDKSITITCVYVWSREPHPLGRVLSHAVGPQQKASQIQWPLFCGFTTLIQVRIQHSETQMTFKRWTPLSDIPNDLYKFIRWFKMTDWSQRQFGHSQSSNPQGLRGRRMQFWKRPFAEGSVKQTGKQVREWSPSFSFCQVTNILMSPPLVRNAKRPKAERHLSNHELYLTTLELNSNNWK